MKTAFITNTPYQIFNVLNIYVNNIEGTLNNADLFIVKRFSNAEAVKKQIASLNIFDNVYLVMPKLGSPKSFVDKICLKRKFERYTYSSDLFLAENYTKIFIGDQMPFGVLMCVYYRTAKVYAYEEGLPYLFGDFLHDQCNGIKSHIKKILKLEIYSVRPEKFYVNNKKVCQSTVAKEIIQLPHWNKENPALITANNVFGFKCNSKVLKYKFILLERPFGEFENFIGIDIEELLLNIGLQEEALIRVHPRSTSKYRSLEVDYGENMWELECINNINDSHVLIGDFSMAQANPKMICNKEPILVFIYKLLYKNLSDSMSNYFEKQINIVYSAYTDKRKIFIPNNVKELSEIIQKIKKEGVLNEG